MKVVVVGASIAGLSSALAVRRKGWDVILLDADDDPGPVTHDGDTHWYRRGTPHALQAHAFLGGFIKALGELAPELLVEILTSGVLDQQQEHLAPVALKERPEARDPEIRVLGSRRPHVEWFVRRRVLGDRGVAWRPGAHVRALSVRNHAGPPHVTGVVLDGGERIEADVVIDASGRRSNARTWLADAGVALPEGPSGSCETAYRSRHYRMRDRTVSSVLPNGHMLVDPYPTFVALLFPGDNGIVQFALGTLPNDPMFEGAHDARVFHAIMASSPVLSAWVDPDRTEPVTEVGVYGGLYNRLQPLVVDGEPLVTGFHFVGDAGAITNPQYGRGVSHAALHALAVAEIVTTDGDPRAHALAVDAEVRRMIEPSVRDSIVTDRARAARWRAALDKRLPDAPEEAGLPPGITLGHYFAASESDPVAWRALMRSACLLDPPMSWHRNEDVVARVRAAEPLAMPAPDSEAARAQMARVEEAIAAAT